ncbi:MAG: threonine/serine exporter family protein [Deltaproteobacteria bacterium]|nr:threonine/serine exporter family protein [Deltaproteobacteria bacterium]
MPAADPSAVIADRAPAHDRAGPGAADSYEASVRFTLELGRALHCYGTPAHRLEEVMTLVSAQLGLVARFVSTPTSINASFGPPEALRTTIIRVEPGGVDLDRTSRLDEVANAVIERRMSPGEGAQAIGAILARPPTYGPLITVACYGLSAAAGADLFGGGLKEVAVSFGIGLVIGVLALLAGKIPGLARGFEPTGAFIASAASVVLTRVLGHFSTEVTTLAALVYLLPGLTLTLAMTELATRNLMSGTSRMTGAAMVFLQLAFGVALGRRVDVLLPKAPPVVELIQLPAWTTVPTLIVITLSLAVLFRARLRDVGWILLAAVLAYGGGRLGARWLGPELGAFVGALALGVVSNAIARALNRPTAITTVPGVMVLVPGSVGFRSLESMMAQDVVAGLATAFSMILVLVGMAAGLILANSIVPPRKVQL